MKRILTLVFAIAIGTGLYAIDKQALADTLTNIVHQHAFAGKVDVSRVHVKKQQIWIYTNATLSHVSLTPKEVSAIRLLVSKMILGNNQGKVTIYSGDLELGELVTSVHRNRNTNMRYTLKKVPSWVRNISAPHLTNQGLSGKHIALWGSHGRYYHQTILRPLG